MRLRKTASVLTVLCSWILWEKWTLNNPGEQTQRTINAVYESKTLEECRGASPEIAKRRANGFRTGYKEPDYTVTQGDFEAILFDKRRKTTFMEYSYYCLPPTVDPYRDTR
jgi:hypothetical protein